MKNSEFDTLSQATNGLIKEGFTENFRAGDTKIIGSVTKKEFSPSELEVIEFYRFDGKTNPQDDSAVFAIKAKDGTMGTLVMSYSAQHDQNVELIKAIPKATD